MNTSYIDLLYFDNLLLKTPDLCNLRTFVAIFFCRDLRTFSANFWEAKKQIPPIHPLLECMVAPDAEKTIEIDRHPQMSQFDWKCAKSLPELGRRGPGSVQ